MPMSTIPELVENGHKLWDSWSIRACIILSLSLQTFLILVAPLRKRNSSKVIALLIWSAYLSADWVAVFVVGHIATSETDGQLLGFWAPFLLLHLGGPDTITALNLEDNSLWVRHLLSLLLQVITTGYILFQTFPSGSKLLVPAILIFVSGILKYFERTRALYHASIGQYRNSILKDSSKPTSEPHKSTYDFEEGGDLDNCEVAVKHAYNLYKVSRGIIVDLVLRLDKHVQTREFFQKIREPQDALKLLSIELNFFYDAFYTKAIVVRTVLGFVFRCVVYVNVTLALVLFVRLSKDTYRNFDVKLTYALLFGAIALEGIALLTILFSDWSVPSTIITKFKNACFLTRVLNYFTRKRSTSLIFRRWSESVSSYGLCFPPLAPLRKGLLELPETNVNPFFRRCFYLFISILFICLYSIPSCIISICFTVTGIKFLFNYVVDKLGVREEIHALKHVSSVPVSKELWNFIFLELREKSLIASQDKEAAHRILRAKGDWVLQTDEFEEDCRKILRYVTKSEEDDQVTEPEYDQVLLTWNIATELCYYEQFLEQVNQKQQLTETMECYFSMTLSGYMLYLLVKQPSMMSAIAGEGRLRYRDTRTDTWEELKKCIERSSKFINKIREHCDSPIYQWTQGSFLWGLDFASRVFVCSEILGPPSATNVGSDSRISVRSKSVFLDACNLARELRSFDVEKRWRIMSKVWVELLSYAAAHSKGEAHAKALIRGGELITFVWLLMIHLGISQSGMEVLAIKQIK